MLLRCLRTFHARYFRHQPKRGTYVPTMEEASRFHDMTNTNTARLFVKNIYSTLHQIVATVNGQIKFWDVDPDMRLCPWSEGGKKRKSRPKRKSISSIKKYDCKFRLNIIFLNFESSSARIKEKCFGQQ